MMTRAATGPRVAAVVPAYRVGGQIAGVLATIPPWVDPVIVVDDASPDDLARRVLDSDGERVWLIRHRTNQGVGGAMLSGYSLAVTLGADVVVKLDGDGQMDPAQLPRLTAPILSGEADYCKGNRFLHAAALRQMPPPRRWGNLALTFLTKLASGYWDIFDPTNGYTAIHSEVLRLLDPTSISRGYFFESSMLLELRRVQAVVRDVAMPARYGDEPSSLSLGRSLREFPRLLLRGCLRRFSREYFLYQFTSVSVLLLAGLPLLLFGAVWGAVHWYRSVSLGSVASTGTVLLAVLPILLGMQMLLQALILDIGSAPRRPVHRCSHDWRNRTISSLPLDLPQTAIHPPTARGR